MLQDTPKGLVTMKEDMDQMEEKLNKKIDQERKERMDNVKEIRGDIDRIIGKDEKNVAAVPSLVSDKVWWTTWWVMLCGEQAGEWCGCCEQPGEWCDVVSNMVSDMGIESNMVSDVGVMSHLVSYVGVVSNLVSDVVL